MSGRAEAYRAQLGMFEANDRPPLMPDASRADVVSRFDDLASLIEEALPATIDVSVPFGFRTVAGLLLARLARLARSLAQLVATGHDFDAMMLMRGVLEHTTLLAWLGIDATDSSVATGGSTWKARTPDENARWWVAEQFERDLRRVGQLAHHFPDRHDEATYQRDLKGIAALFSEERAWGKLPRIEDMASEADARWGKAIRGWPDAEPGHPAYSTTLRGFDALLKQLGNTAAHPHLGATLRAFVEPGRSDGRGRLVSELSGEEAETAVVIAAYMLLYAIGVVEHSQGWPSLDAGLRILGRYADVRHPDLLLNMVAALLGGDRGLRHGLIDGKLVAIQRDGATTEVVLVGRDLAWQRIFHRSGLWSFGSSRGDDVLVGRGQMTGEAVQKITDALVILERAVWLPRLSR